MAHDPAGRIAEEGKGVNPTEITTVAVSYGDEAGSARYLQGRLSALPACRRYVRGPPFQALRDRAWHALDVKLLARLNMAQRVIIVIAFGVALALFGYWVALHDVYAFGWVSYSPMPTRVAKPRGLTFGEIILVWLGLTIAWAVASTIVFHRPKPE
jgi:hypothetical protein